ncbi:MAG: thioredoxin family protein [Bacteroidia bacterium]
MKKNNLKIGIILSVIIFSSCSIFNKNKTSKMELNGITKQADLTGNKIITWFDDEYKNYVPNQLVINSIKPLKNEIKVLVVAGSWCGDTQRELPRFFKIINSIGVPNNQIEMIMVDENKKTAAFNISVIQVTNIPTFIFFKDGKELGRIIEKPQTTLEDDLAKMLQIK